MKQTERQYALEYTFYMVLEQELSLVHGRCRTVNSPYLKKLSLAWAELPGSYIDKDFEHCEKIMEKEIVPMLSVPFCDHSRIVITPKEGEIQSDITVYAGNEQLILNVSLTQDGNVECQKTVISA